MGTNANFALVAIFTALLVGGGPASAFDCAKAASVYEKAICGDARARAADAAMAAAFEALRHTLDHTQAAKLVAAQARWIGEHDSDPYLDDEPNDERNYDCSHEDDDAKLAACLTRESDARRRFLSGAPDAGPGPRGKIVPYFKIQQGGPGSAEIDIQALRFLSPANRAERAFNVAVDRLIAAGSDLASETRVWALQMRLTYASPRLISAHSEGVYVATGMGHRQFYSADINIDVAAGREASFDSLLDTSAAPKIFALCADQVATQSIDRDDGLTAMDADGSMGPAKNEGADTSDGVRRKLLADVSKASADLRAWSFGAAAATITYDFYTTTAAGDLHYTCEIPYPTLRPLAKPGFPLP